jgi:hypothetical protein
VFEENDKLNKFKTIVAPVKSDDVMWINQDAYFSIGKFNEDTIQNYSMQHNGNGAYIFVIEGEATIANEALGKRDAIGIWETDNFELKIKTNSEILIIEVPMN